MFLLSCCSKRNGLDPNLPIYIAIHGTVMDVTSCNAFGPLGVLTNFAGKECATAFARTPFRPAYLRNDAGDRLSFIETPSSSNEKGEEDGKENKETLEKWTEVERSNLLGWQEALTTAGHQVVGTVLSPRVFTPGELRTYTGNQPSSSSLSSSSTSPPTTNDGMINANNPIYLSVRGTVYDVSRGRDFYGPGGPYATFTGEEVARAFALMSQDPKDFNDDLTGLSQTELGILSDWEAKFQAKYDIVGKLNKKKES